MKITLKHYKRSDFKDLKRCMENLQDFLVDIDPLKRMRRLSEYGENYTKSLVKEVSKQRGLIILAYDKKKIIGCIAGIIKKQSKKDILECIPTKSGKILELFVLEDYRGRELGKRLMQQMENYFKKNKCGIIKVEVFAPNKNAYKFYQRLNYSNRVIDMIKIIKNQTFK